MNKTLEEIRKIEFEKIDYHTLSDDYFDVIEGKIPILISAPHGARHLRPTIKKQGDKWKVQDVWKEEDEYTSSIAIKLGQMTGAHVIYVKNKTIEDPNHEKVSKYKIAIKEIIKDHDIKFLADIHGAKSSRDFKVCVGTRYDEKEKCSCRTYKDIIENTLKEFQEGQIFNRTNFKAKDDVTVTSFAKKVCGIESAQFEINEKYRIIERKPDSSKAIAGTEPNFKADEKDVSELFNHLKEMILKINEAIEQKKRSFNA